MIQINQLKIGVEKQPEGEMELSMLKKQAVRKINESLKKKKINLKVSVEDIERIEIVKKSIDARKKNQVHYSYCVKIGISKEKKKKLWDKKLPDVLMAAEKTYCYQPCGEVPLKHRPVIVGMGPAGLFLGLLLAEAGYRPVILEQGSDVERRQKAVESFWETGVLDAQTNVQFGEGGAGTFSDGKLNTMVKDTVGRNRLVLELFVKYGAPPDILYKNKPHIGTDKLRLVVKNMRERMKELGAEICFDTKMTDIQVEDGRVISVTAGGKQIPCEVLVLAIGHSARDTFSLLKQKHMIMEPKPFAIGIRVEHRQELINQAQYGQGAKYLPAADYKLTHQTGNGRSVYSFCMCPGGYVVNASSEQGMTVVNGMSNYARDGRNANSALIVTVTPEDFRNFGNGRNLEDSLCVENGILKGESPVDVLAGVEFQRNWERQAFLAGGGSVPVQLYGDLLEGKVSTSFGNVTPDTKGSYRFADLRSCLPDYVTASLLEGMKAFDKKIPGYGSRDAVFFGVETRTSSPVRILRDDSFQGSIKGIYPCGEGAGYAGGITSAAMDGIRVYEAVTSEYKPC
jgi:hypothetical protein